MGEYSSFNRKTECAKLVICPKCDRIMSSEYIEDECPSCKTSLLLAERVYMPNMEEAMHLAQIIVQKNIARRNGFDDDD